MRRDRDSSEWLLLPAEGRKGKLPRWPLPDPTEREKKLWKELWAMPQAVAWEAQDQEREVALYVRTLVLAEKPGAPTQRVTLMRQMADALGITIPGMARNRWKIGKAVAERPRPKRGASARERFKLVEGG